MLENIKITGPHGIKEGREFFHIYQTRELEKLNRLLQFSYWVVNGYEIFGYCFGGFLLVYKLEVDYAKIS